jgi:serine/threonine protein kinase
MGANLERGALLHKRYRIVEILGQGGMGSVYRAVDENLGVDVAVKENLFTTDEYARQFRLEAVILANLRHANLPRVTDHFVVGEQGQYLIMDFIDGEDLRQRMERVGSISEEETILIGAAICDALQYLHTRKPSIIHRDIKPGNVRITPDGHIYLVDFGLAKLVKGSQATTTGARAMTPGYSPPEQYGTARTGPRTDVYSLGATLYAALTGVIPEDGLSRAMDNVELTPVRKRNPKVSRKLSYAVEKAMAVRPEDRFQTADEFRQALLTTNVRTQRLEGAILVEPPPQVLESDEENNGASEMPLAGGNDPAGPLPPPPSTSARKNRSGNGWVFLSFFLIASILVLSAFFFRSPITKLFARPSPTPTASSTSTPIPTLASTPTTVSSATKTPQIVKTLPSSTPAQATVTLNASITLTRSTLPTYVPLITPSPTITFGPTPTYLGGGSNVLAFVSSRTGAPQVYTMNSDGSNLQQVTNMTFGACQPDWSPDGTRMVVISPCPKRQDQYPDAKMYIINANGSGLPAEMASVPGGDFDPAWSPDGTRIAFTSLRDGSANIFTINLGDNSITRLTETSSDIKLPDWSAQPAWSPSGTQILFTGHSRLTNALQIWMMSDTGQGHKILFSRGSELWNFRPGWAPDGKTILFGETMGAQELGWLMRFDYQAATVSHLRNQAFGANGEYSPDGKWIIYESKDSEDLTRFDYDIYRIQADGLGPIIRLTNSPSWEFDAVWRPIGTP